MLEEEKVGFIETIKAIILGIIEGITEWLPISSTGHMILVDNFIKLDFDKAFMEMFFVVIQLGAIFAVVLLFWNKMFPFSFKEKPCVKKDIFTIWFKVLVAVIPAIIIGVPFDDKITEIFYNYEIVALMLIVYGALFIVIENKSKGKSFRIRKLSEITYKDALFIGIFQVLALIPGTSRSGATIIGAMLIGVSRYAAAEFTFFLAVPVMFGASLLKVVKYIGKVGLTFTGAQISALLIGMAIAFVVSLLVIKFLMTYIKKHDFKIFGYYRIALGIIVIGYAFLVA